MTIEEFREKAKDEDYVPGWDFIDNALEKLYGSQEPVHFATKMEKRAMFGGPEYLDGYSAYKSENGYAHVITYGMTELYADEEQFGGQYSKWGYEMTIKVKDTEPGDTIWAMNMLGNLARYTFQSERWFEPGQFVGSLENPESIDQGRPDSKITSLLITEDTELEGGETVYGEVKFLQLVGVTTEEFAKVRADRSLVSTLLENLRADYPNLETDLDRTKNYI